MHQHFQRAAATLAALMAITACSSSGSNSNNTSSTDSAAAMGPAASTPTTSSPAVGAGYDTSKVGTAASSAGGEVGTTAMSDANILAKADAGDSAEVTIAKYIASNTTNAKVKAYAHLLERDHGKGISKVEGTAKRLSLALQLPANDTTAQETSHVLDHLKSLNGADRDSAFVNHEIEDHQHDIADAKQMMQSAQKPEVKALLQNELPELQKHLDRAQALSKALGGK